MGFVYAVQPTVLLGTQRYKIGMSALDNMSRLKAYGVGVRVIITIECDDARAVESLLLTKFNDKYKLIAGNEYFEIDDELAMINLFVNTVMEHKNTTKEESVVRCAASWMDKYAYATEKTESFAKRYESLGPAKTDDLGNDHLDIAPRIPFRKTYRRRRHNWR